VKSSVPGIIDKSVLAINLFCLLFNAAARFALSVGCPAIFEKDTLQP
jgi:hypothetical protein